LFWLFFWFSLGLGHTTFGSKVPSIQVLVEHDEVEVDPTTIEREYQHFSKITPEQ
jgi:DNA-binding transcriptional regulator YhcF (GntR family)